MQTLETYLKEVRDLHRQAVEMFKDVKENHLAHIEPDIKSLKSDVSAINTRLKNLEDKIDQLLSK